MSPETAQTEGELEAKITARPELATAPIENGAIPVVTLLSAPNVIV